MKLPQLLVVLVASLFASASFAQTVASEVQRNVNQQQRIENGLKSGQLNTKEAARLEKQEQNISNAEAKALKDGKLSQAEKQHIDQMQNKVSKNINAEKHDGQLGNPNSASSQRMQADVQRNVNQQQRIENGVKDGSLTNREVAKLEKGQAKVTGKEYRAGKDGHVGQHEQKNVQHAENKQSHKIHKNKTDGQNRS
jgi:hypothetical protein